MPTAITDWLDGVERPVAVSPHFATVDGTERIGHTDQLVDDLARRVMEAKSSRQYLEKYASRLGWEFIAQRLQRGLVRVSRGDFGEVVAVGWLVDYLGLETPVQKLRLQVNPGQTLPGTDAVGFEVADGEIVRAHFLESKLRTTPARLPDVGVDAYRQLESDRREGFLEILQFIHERMFNAAHRLTDALTLYLEGRQNSDEDAHEIVLTIEATVWDERVLSNLDGEAADLPACTVHVLHCRNLAQLVEETFGRIGAELISDMEED